MAHKIETQRQQLISELRNNGFGDERILSVIATTPRELFIDDAQRNMAYSDCALPIAMGQTISQPMMVALMTQALQLSGKERVLEIGTGSGYQAAILARLAAHVYSVERFQQLAYRQATSSQFYGDGRRQCGLADATLAHQHHQTVFISGDVVYQFRQAWLIEFDR